MRENLSNRATIKCQVSVWLVTRGLWMTAFLYASHSKHTVGTWASLVFSTTLNHAVLQEIFYIIFDCVFCHVSLCSVCRHTRRLFAKTNGSVWADDHLVSSTVENKCDPWDLADAYCLCGDDNRSHCLTPFW